MESWIHTSSPRRTLACLLLFNLILRVILATALPLTYKEAYFWEWSQFPALGYLDHPPMVGWILAAVSHWLPEYSPLCLRVAALLLGSCTLLLIYKLTHNLFQSTAIALRAAFVASIHPVMQAAGILILPDSPLIVFHLLALIWFSELQKRNFFWMWGIFGVLLGLGLMCKLMMGLTILGFAIYMRWQVPEKGVWGWRGPLFGVACILLVVSPFLYWNATHDWANLRLQLWDRHWRNFGFEFWKAGEYFAEQAAASTPFLLPLFVLSLLLPNRRLPFEWQAGALLLKVHTALVLVFFLVASSFITQAHPHWTLLAYPTASCLLALHWELFPGRRAFRILPKLVSIGQVVFAVLVLLVAIAPQLSVMIPPEMLGRQLGNGLVKGRQRLLGLGGLTQEIEAKLSERGLPQDAPIFTDGYQLAAPLSFSYHQSQVVCLPAYTHRKKDLGQAQYYYLVKEGFQGREGLYISRSKSPTVADQLAGIFDTVTPLGVLEHRCFGSVIGEYQLFQVGNLR